MEPLKKENTDLRELTADEITHISGGALSGGLEITLKDFHPVAWPRILLPKVAKDIIYQFGNQ